MKKLLKIIFTATILTTLFVGCNEVADVIDSEVALDGEVQVEPSEDVEASEDNNTDAEATEDIDPNEYFKEIIEQMFPPITDKTQLPQLTEVAVGDPIAVMKTSMGDITLRLFPEQAPKAVENFQKLAESGYYDGVIFHRVINDFVIQGGDPLGNGTGGESFDGGKFDDEISPYLKHFSGALAMANSGPNTNGSQFYIVENDELEENDKYTAEYYLNSQDDFLALTEQEDGPTVLTSRAYPKIILEEYLEKGGRLSLDGGYTIFGQVFEGMDIVHAIADLETDESDKPVEDVIINNIEIGTYGN